MSETPTRRSFLARGAALAASGWLLNGSPADARPLLERALAGSPLDGGCKQVETGIAAAQFAALCAQLRFWTREPVVGL